MRVTYNPEADAAYIYLRDKIKPKGIARTRSVEDSRIKLDFDRHGVLLGIEVLSASALLPPELVASAQAPRRPPRKRRAHE